MCALVISKNKSVSVVGRAPEQDMQTRDVQISTVAHVMG